MDFVTLGYNTINDVTACPGTDTCNLGIASSTGIAVELERVLATEYPQYSNNQEITIKISGCMNACGQHNIANIGLVLGVILLINAVQVDNSFYVTDWPVKMFASTLLFIFLVIDGTLSRIEGFIFIIVLITFLIFLIRKNKTTQINIEDNQEEVISIVKIGCFLALGGFALWLGSELLVKGAVNLAESLGVSKRIIAITVVSIGTSVPELASSIIASIKKENDISVGNIIGSNIFNILSVLGVTAIIKPIEHVDVRIIQQDIYWMLGFAFFLLTMVILPKRGNLSFKEGVLLLGSYVIFLYFTMS